jgi:hypothetical protein
MLTFVSDTVIHYVLSLVILDRVSLTYDGETARIMTLFSFVFIFAKYSQSYFHFS